MARCMCCELDTVWTTLTKNQANVMLSYPIDEAEELLTGKLAGAKQNLANCEEDQEFVREQIKVSAAWCSRSICVVPTGYG